MHLIKMDGLYKKTHVNLFSQYTSESVFNILPEYNTYYFSKKKNERNRRNRL